MPSLLRIQDDRKRVMDFYEAPKRVVSLVPSDTLTLAAIGCAGALVGRTDFCELPPDVVAAVPSIGGTKNPRVDDVCALSPDLVLANQEENTRKDLEELANRGVRVYVAFPKRVADGIAGVAKLARLFRVGDDPRVVELLKRGYEELRAAAAIRTGTEPLRAFCPIWMDPLMTINGDTFVSDMLASCGARNVFAERERRYPLAADVGRAVALSGDAVFERDTRYPRITLDEVIALEPDVILLPDEPHPFSEDEAEAFRALDVPAAHRGAVVRTDGKDLCWHGARSIEALPRVRALLARFRS